MVTISREFIAKKLKQLRERAGLTVYQVGELVGKSGKTVSAWENNHGQPDAEILMKLCDIYNVSDILAEFRDTSPLKNRFEITTFERKLVESYRAHPEMQAAINKMLDISEHTEKSASLQAISDDSGKTVVDDIVYEFKKDMECATINIK